MNPKVWYIPAKRTDPGMNVGIYCRVSTGEKNQLYSLAAQIAALTRAVANVEQWKLTDTSIDIASAKGESPRREFERMTREAEAHHISVILTKSISCFGRDTVDTLQALNVMKEFGVRMIFEQESLDTKDVESSLMISIIESLAQAENESRSDNIKWGIHQRAAQGTSKLYDRKCYGYEHDENWKLIINEEQAVVVRKIFNWYLGGLSINGIIKELEKQTIKSPTGKDKWNKRSLEVMLSNEKYKGAVRLFDDKKSEVQYLVSNNNPTIITEEVFVAVQKEKANRSNIEVDENGNQVRKSTKYSSRKKRS